VARDWLRQLSCGQTDAPTESDTDMLSDNKGRAHSLQGREPEI